MLSTDLAEVQSVASASPVQVGTKKIDERAFFDVSFIHFEAIDLTYSLDALINYYDYHCFFAVEN